MAQDLAKLITQYRWLQSQRSASGVLAGSGGDESVEVALERVFTQIVNYPASDPRISYRQIAFLLGVLADGPNADAEAREFLCDAVLGHVKRLADRVTGQERVTAGL